MYQWFWTKLIISPCIAWSHIPFPILLALCPHQSIHPSQVSSSSHSKAATKVSLPGWHWNPGTGKERVILAAYKKWFRHGNQSGESVFLYSDVVVAVAWSLFFSFNPNLDSRRMMKELPSFWASWRDWNNEATVSVVGQVHNLFTYIIMFSSSKQELQCLSWSCISVSLFGWLSNFEHWVHFLRQTCVKFPSKCVDVLLCVCECTTKTYPINRNFASFCYTYSLFLPVPIRNEMPRLSFNFRGIF